MTVPMDSSFDPVTRERAELLYKKNVELENRLRRSAQARVPSDPNIWHQMRENYEAIILEDHAFAEKNELEYALWQLHYRRIEELRAHFSAALSSNTAASQDGKGSSKPDRISKIRSQFKTFLSEATGFYHDLMLKIRAKYGLPLGYFSDDPENKVFTSEGAKSTEVKKGLISCHRCLIYLGDLSRYKGLYGEGDSKARDFAAASSYYMQASSLLPSSGNPHHQLAILASYSGDELVAIYRYFRSLAVENPFSTARENLIIAFEKNRQNYTLLLADAKASPVKNANARTGRGRGKGAVPPVKDKSEVKPIKEGLSTKAETLRAFSTRFVRLNGVLFTRTSLETFEDVLSSVKVDLLELLSSGPEEEHNFASEPGDSGLTILRLIVILIFTVHIVNRETENQSYAEILQRSVLLENAYTAVFEIMRHFIERCAQLHDPSSSFLLPGVLVFMEWLACHLEIAVGSEAEEKQAKARSLFWTNCISLLNKLISSGFAAGTEEGDDTCFSNMSRYDDSETGNRLALWEDLELRGFLPLLPAQQILDFSRKHSVGSDGGSEEKKSRIQRIISAGKALTNVVRIGQEVIYFDQKSKKFTLGVGPQICSDIAVHSSDDIKEANESQQVQIDVKNTNAGFMQLKDEGEEEDEVIVFRPSVADKCADIMVPEVISHGAIGTSSNAIKGVSAVSADLESAIGSSSSLPLNSAFMQNVYDTGFQPSLSVGLNVVPQLPQSIQPSSSRWLEQQQSSFVNELKHLNSRENGHVKPGLPHHVGVLQPAVLPVSASQSVPISVNGECTALTFDSVVPSKFDSVMSLGANYDSLAVKSSSGLPANSRKNPVSRPVRHLGPPPGFCPFPPKASVEPFSGITLMNDNRQMDDYGLLDKYELSSVMSTGYNNHANQFGQTHLSNKNSGVTGAMNFPFPGKQVPVRQAHVVNETNYQNHNLPNRFNLYQEQLQQVQKATQQSTSMPEQHNGQSLWENRFLV